MTREQEKRLHNLVGAWGLMIVACLCMLMTWVIPDFWAGLLFVIGLVALIASIRYSRDARIPKDKEEPHA